MRRYRVTIDLDVMVSGADDMKDLHDQDVADQIAKHLNHQEDGRGHLAIETLSALTHGLGIDAIYQAVANRLWKRYGNRMHKIRKGQHVGVAGEIARRRTAGVQAHSYVSRIIVASHDTSNM